MPHDDAPDAFHEHFGSVDDFRPRIPSRTIVLLGGGGQGLRFRVGVRFRVKV